MSNSKDDQKKKSEEQSVTTKSSNHEKNSESPKLALEISQDTLAYKEAERSSPELKGFKEAGPKSKDSKPNSSAPAKHPEKKRNEKCEQESTQEESVEKKQRSSPGSPDTKQKKRSKGHKSDIIKSENTKNNASCKPERSPPIRPSVNRSENSRLALEPTQEASINKEVRSSPDCDKRSKSHRSAVIQCGYTSRRVRYKKEGPVPVEGAVNIDRDLMKNDKTLRDEDWFLAKIEKCKNKKQQRVCVCPFPRCYRITDAFDGFKGTWHRIKRVCFLACCPPFCCIIERSAFWPPPREYYFFLPPPDDVIIEVSDESDAILMKARKKKLKKLRKARKCELGKKYNFGLNHPCADDVKHVQGFVLKTSKRNSIGCIHIPCPDGATPRFTMLYSHPNGSDLSDHLVGVPSLIDIARFYRCEVYSYDYSGYGISSGLASESNVYADIRAVYQCITVEKRVDPKKLVLLGYSIGAAATVELLRHEQDRKPAGVILQSPPTSILRVIENMVRRKTHLDKPTCCMDRFVTLDKIHEVKIPVLIIHGKEDRTVPIQHGELLCERAINKVPPEWVPEAAHDNIENCREVWRRIRKFVKVELDLK